LPRISRTCGVGNGYAIIRSTVERAIDQLDAAAIRPHYELFDIVWFDPPYDDQPDAGSPTAAGVLIFAPGGLLVARAMRAAVQAPGNRGSPGAGCGRCDSPGDFGRCRFYELKN